MSQAQRRSTYQALGTPAAFVQIFRQHQINYSPALLTMANQDNNTSGSKTYIELGWTGGHITFGSGYDVAVSFPVNSARLTLC